MANSFAGTFSVVKEPSRKTEKLVVVRLVDRSYKGEPFYFDAEIYDKLGETAERFLTPGKTVFFSGELYNHVYKEKDYIRYRVSKMEFIDSPDSSKRKSEQKSSTTKSDPEPALAVEGDGKDIAF